MQSEDNHLPDLLNFLHNHDVAVVATMKSGNVPHASTIYYHAEDDLRFYFLTKDLTMKFNNIKENHSIALVISDAQTLQTVQVEGIAKEVDYAKEYAPVVEKFTQKLAQNGKDWDKIPLNHIKDSGYYIFVQITPTWIRWSDYKNWEHSVIYEKHFS